MASPLRILIADDHAVVRAGTRALLEREPKWEVCGEAQNGREALDLCLRLQPDILILDFNMSDLNGEDIVRELTRRKTKIEILIFSAHEAEEIIQDLYRVGAKSYIRKADAPEHLVAAIHALSEHKPYFTPAVSALLFAQLEKRSWKTKPLITDRKLSPRERDVLRLIADGKSNKEMATTLGISVRTTETHRATILRKLRLDSVAALVRYALRNGLVEN